MSQFLSYVLYLTLAAKYYCAAACRLNEVFLNIFKYYGCVDSINVTTRKDGEMPRWTCLTAEIANASSSRNFGPTFELGILSNAYPESLKFIPTSFDPV